MISFYGILSEEDISAYAGTLILPSFMAHLERMPFRFAEQASNVDGLQPLKICYVGDGRLEDFFIHPEKHALSMLAAVCHGLDAKQIRVCKNGTIWRWSHHFGGTPVEENEDIPVSRMRVYFESTPRILPSEISIRFDPRHCYVSVTRKELFLAREVVQGYIAAWFDLFSRNGNEQKTDNPVVVEPIAGGFAFHNNRFGGELVLQDDEIFTDLLRFCGLGKSLEELSSIIRPDLDSPELEINDDGLRIRLAVIKASEK